MSSVIKESRRKFGPKFKRSKIRRVPGEFKGYGKHALKDWVVKRRIYTVVMGDKDLGPRRRLVELGQAVGHMTSKAMGGGD